MSDIWTPDVSQLGDLATMDYDDLVAALQKDLQLDASTDILPNTFQNVSGLLKWTTPTLLNSWTARGGDPAGYLKDPMGFVHLRGRLTGGGSGTAAFVLPVGYRPGNNDDLYAAAAYAGGTAAVGAFADIVASNGTVNPYYAAGTTDVGLGGITFLAEN